MDKRIIFAVAGSGKTTLLIANLNLEKRFLVVTYTENNLKNLRFKIIQKFGFFPPNITLYSYFSFLHSFCYRPFLALELRTKGIFWDMPPEWTGKLPLEDTRRYIHASQRLYYNRIAKFLTIKNVFDEVIKRVEKYFDTFYVDEVQDFAGHDFNLLTAISASKLGTLLVGDFYQHTFDTSRDGATNRTLHEDYLKYQKRFEKIDVNIDLKTLVNSHRCSATVCKFIKENIGIEIDSHTDRETNVQMIDDQDGVDQLFSCETTIKLFYQGHDQYDCYSQNWGGSKGQDHYADVCVVLNKTTYQLYKKQDLISLPPQTKNKFYVACSRARGNLYFVPETMLKKYKSSN